VSIGFRSGFEPFGFTRTGQILSLQVVLLVRVHSCRWLEPDPHHTGKREGRRAPLRRRRPNPIMSARDRETTEALVRFAASLDGAVLGLGTAAVAVVSWVKYLAVARELRLVASATAASIVGVRSILPEDGEPRLVAVRGIVRTIPGGSYLKAPGSGEYGVVTKHTQMVSRAAVRLRLVSYVHFPDLGFMLAIVNKNALGLIVCRLKRVRCVLRNDTPSRKETFHQCFEFHRRCSNRQFGQLDRWL
jgi:hypothetical protein